MKQILLFVSMALLVACTPKQRVDGIWINVKYDQQLQDTKSPIEAQGVAEYSMVEIDAAASKILVVIHLHEGMNEEIKNKGGDLSFDLYDGTSVPIRIEGEKLQVGDNQFIRLKEANFQQYVNKNTLVGHYQTQDGTPVIFNTDGTLSGLAGYTNFSVMYDYYGDGSSVNMVLVTDNGIGTTYTWEKEGDKLSLFNVIYADPENKTQGSRGELMIELKKI